MPEDKITKVQKRDGAIVEFDQTRIQDAIFKALTATGQGDGNRAKKLSDRVVQILNRRFKTKEIPQVEQIQDIVEEILILEGLVEAAKAYILYREQRRRIREATKVAEEAVDRVDQYLEKLDWEVQENANMAFSLQGLNHYGVSYIVKKYWLNKIYPKEIREANEGGDFHIHNLDTLGPYTFFGREVVVAKLNGDLKLISLKDLYKEIPQEEILLSEKDQAFAKYPKDLSVLDRNSWTKVSRMVRKKKEREMCFIKSEQGQSIIITDNHPFIVKRNKKENEIDAKEVQEKNDLIYSARTPDLLKSEKLFSKKYLYLAEELINKGHRDFFLEGFVWEDFIKNWEGSLRVPGTLSTSNSANSLNNKLELTEDLGYLVGFFIAEGNYDSWRLAITTSEKEIIEKIQRICAGLGIRSYIQQKEGGAKRISINSSTLKLVFEKIFEIRPLSQNKNLPPDILTYNLDFTKGAIAGIIDGDGSIGTNKTQIVIRVASRTVLEQLSILLQFFGIIPRSGVSTEDIGKKNIFRGKEIIQNYPLYRLSFSKTGDVNFPSIKYRKAINAKKHWRSEEYGWNRVLNNKPTTIPDDFIYDITTNSNTFLCNSLLVHNCVGWDLYDLLLKGFGGVPGKVESKPAKHFPAALGQVVNFMYTLQGEAAGAIAFSNFDTLLAPFIRYDNLSYPQVRQALQEFMFNMAIPTRVGFQCVSEDTEILTPEGWKGYDEVKERDEINTLNLKTKEIERKKVKFVFKRKYKGIMYQLRNRIQDQLISPEHRVLRRKFNSEKYVLEPIEDVLKLKSPIIVPTAGKNPNPDINITDEQIKLMAWIISEGSVERPGKHRCCHRVSIYQSKIKNRRYYDEIINLLKDYKLEYANHPATSLGEEVQQIRLNAEGSRKIHQWFGTRENVHFIPEYLLNLSARQSRLFLETYLRGDGKESCKIATSDLGLLDDLERIIVNAGYGFTVRKQKPIPGTVGKKDIYILRIIRHPETYITKIKKINYEGIIWCPHTENGTIIARRKGKVFITGNCPFTNITLDLKPSPAFAKQPVIIGGKPQKETYGEFKEEMKIFDKALYETMLEGDKSGRPFSFPIPTINITEDFPWEDPAFDGIFEASAKYGTNYFANYINSEMKPEDVRSMCCRLRLNLTDLYNRGGGGLFGSGSLTGCYDEKTEILTEGSWKSFKDLTKEDKVFTLADNNKIELHKPKRLFEYNYQGKMVHFKGKSFDLLVTPNHKMVVDHKGSMKRMFVEAKDFKPYQHYIPKGGVWEGEEREYFVLPAVLIMSGAGPTSRFSDRELVSIQTMKRERKSIYQIAEDFNCDPVTIYKICTKPDYGNRERLRIRYEAPPLKVKMDDWLKFFGFWLVEGSTDNEKTALDHGYRVVISQTNQEKRREIKKVLDVLLFNYYEEGPNLVICNKQLWSYLRQFGNKYEKFIPKEIKNLSKRQLKILFNWMVKGDGHVRQTNGQINYWTSSKKLADDLQEIILKLGWLGTLTTQKSKVSQIKGRKVKAGIIHTLGVQKTKHYGFGKKEKIKERIKEVNYKGKVYCCEVENHTVFVRRNGKVTWSGNSIGVVTVNMPRIGYLSKTKGDFFERLGRMMDLARGSLEIKRKTIENFIEKGLYPYSRYYLAGIKKMRDNYWGNHFSTIGLVGMNEALLNFIGENSGSKRGRRFAIEILDFMRKKLVKYQKETGNIYNLEQTPAESTAYRLALKDKEKYPDIITAGTKKTPYYTNSTQLPVNYTDDIFEALKLQDEIQCKYTGGSVLHLFLGERISDIQIVKSLIKKIFGNFRLPYITLTPTFSICPSHGYLEGEHFFCPKCTIKQPCEVYSRIVGYLRPLTQYNLGKQQEFKERKEFKLPKTMAVK